MSGTKCASKTKRMSTSKRAKPSKLKREAKSVGEGLVVCGHCGKTVPRTLYCVVCGNRLLANNLHSLSETGGKLPE